MPEFNHPYTKADVNKEASEERLLLPYGRWQYSDLAYALAAEK